MLMIDRRSSLRAELGQPQERIFFFYRRWKTLFREAKVKAFRRFQRIAKRMKIRICIKRLLNVAKERQYTYSVRILYISLTY